MTRTFHTLFLTSALTTALSGCPSPASSAVTGAAAATTDDAGTGGPDRSEVSRCRALARNFRDNCAESNGEGDERVCLWEGYEALCETGNTSLLIAAMECLDPAECRAFSDPNEGGACLDALAGRSPALTEAYERQCAACGGGTECVESIGRAEILPYLPVSSAGALDACLGADVCTLDAIVGACAPTVDAFAPFQCPSAR